MSTLFDNPFVVAFMALSPFIVFSMLVAVFLVTWNPEVLAKHREGGISIQWTRAILGMTLMLVVALIVVLPRL